MKNTYAYGHKVLSILLNLKHKMCFYCCPIYFTCMHITYVLYIYCDHCHENERERINHKCVSKHLTRFMKYVEQVEFCETTKVSFSSEPQH